MDMTKWMKQMTTRPNRTVTRTQQVMREARAQGAREVRTQAYDDTALMDEIASIREQMETDAESIADMSKKSEQGLLAIREQMEADAQTLSDMTKQAKQNLAAIREITDSLGEHKEYTHDVGVQIYRNVQASLIDELAKQSADREDHCRVMQEKMEELPGKMQQKSTSPLLIITFLISLGNLALLLWICYLNGYFGI